MIEVGDRVAVQITEVLTDRPTDNIGGYEGERAYIVRVSNRPATGYEQSPHPIMVIAEKTPILPSVGIHVFRRVHNSTYGDGRREYDRWIIEDVQEEETTDS